MNDIRAIFYDLDGTLRESQPSSNLIFCQQAQALGLALSAQACREILRWEHAHFAESPALRADRAEFQDDSSAFWVRYSERKLIALGLAPQQAQEFAAPLSAAMRKHYKPTDIIIEDVIPTLARLRQEGYLLGILSNRFEPYEEYLQKRGLLPYFDVVVHAGEVGLRKPNPQPFAHLLQKAGALPQNALYIGDNYFADVRGATGAGMWAALYDPTGIFEAPDCPALQSHTQIFDLLNGRQQWLGNER